MPEKMRISQRLSAWLIHVFRERQVFMRSDNNVRYLTLRPWMQMSAVGACVASALWIALASADVAVKKQIIAAKDLDREQMQELYEERIVELQTKIDDIKDRLMLDQDAYLKRVKEVQSLQELLEERQNTLEVILKKGWEGAENAAKDATTQPKKTRKPAKSTSNWYDAILPTTAFWRSAPKRTAKDVKVGTSRHFASKQAATAPVESLRDKISALDARQSDFLNSIEQDRKARVKRIEKSFAKLGLRPKSIIKKAKKTKSVLAIGGPFVSLNMDSQERKASLKQIKRINRHVDKLLGYQDVVQKLPLARPLPSRYRLTSGFGTRRDPFKRTRAMHQGIDFRGPTGTPVTATSNGRVVRAGRVGGYGKMVELRHSNGITTRYAHLSRIDVKVGQKVLKHHRIGRIGSTGRSTGPHLHYETRVFGRAIDPRRLWRVGSNVLKEKIH